MSMNPVLERETAFNEANAQLEIFLASFNRHRVNISLRLMQQGSVMAARYELSSHDALIVALLQDYGLNHLGVIDNDFCKVDHLELWDGLLIP